MFFRVRSQPLSRDTCGRDREAESASAIPPWGRAYWLFTSCGERAPVWEVFGAVPLDAEFPPIVARLLCNSVTRTPFTTACSPSAGLAVPLPRPVLYIRETGT